MPQRRTIALVTAVSALMATTATVEAADVTYERLLNPEPQNWLTHHRDYSAQRYSPLEVINKSNIKTLKLMFAIPLGGREHRGHPAGRRWLPLYGRQLGRGHQDRRALRHGWEDRVEDGSQARQA